MGPFFIFLFWTSAYFVLLGLVYHFLVRPQNTPAFSRIFVLSGLFFSVLAGLGFLNRATGFDFLGQGGVVTLPEMVIHASEGMERSQIKMNEFLMDGSFFLILSLMISSFLFIRFAGSVIFLVLRGRMLKGKKVGNLLVIPVRGERSPFSFFSLVFVPEGLLKDPSLQQVLLHEQAHVKCLHSLDLLFLEILTIFFWFHPVVWYLRREIKMQHEYEADRFVLDQQVDKARYQHLLLSFSFRGKGLPVTNPFNYSPLKNRIMMMNLKTRKSPKRAVLSILASAALFSGMLLLQSAGLQASHFSAPQGGSFAALLEEAVLPAAAEASLQPPPPPPPAPAPPAREGTGETTFTVVENPPQFPGGFEALANYMIQNVKYPPEARQAGVQGTVFVSFIIEKDGKVTNVKVIRSVSEALDNEAVRVVSAMPAWEPGTQRGEKVRVQFNLPVRFTLSDDGDSKSSSSEEGASLGSSEKPAIFIDGVKVDTEGKDLDEIISPDEIESINVLKGGQGREMYGYDNVIAITRKKQ